MAVGMSEEDMKNKLSLYQKEYEEKKRSKNELINVLHEQEQKFVCYLTVSLICLLFNVLFFNNMVLSENGNIKVVGMAMRPIMLIIFFPLFIIALIKGYDWFINSRFEYGQKLAQKLKIATVSSKIQGLDNAMDYLLKQIELYEQKLTKCEQEKELNEMIFK